jgi:hypothetical protein
VQFYDPKLASVQVVPAKKAPSGGIEIVKSKEGFRYRIVDAEGKPVAMPTAKRYWETRAEVIAEIESLKQTLNNATPRDVKE